MHEQLQLVFTLFLCAVTMVFFSHYDRYTYVGDNLLLNSNFSKGLERWESKHKDELVFAEDKIAHLVSITGAELVYLRQRMESIKVDELLEFSGAIKLSDVERGDKKWQRVHFVAVGVDVEGNTLYREPHFLASISGTQQWHVYRHVFRISERVKYLQFSAQMPMVKGQVWVRDLAVRKVIEKRNFKLWLVAALMLWGTFVVGNVINYVKEIKPQKKVLHIASILILIGYAMLLPHSVIVVFEENIFGFFTKVFGGFSSELPLGVAKDDIEHFVIFFLLSFYVIWNAKTTKQFVICGNLLISFAMFTEVIQLLVEGRNYQSHDFVSDLIGILVAVFILFYLLTTYKKTEHY